MGTADRVDWSETTRDVLFQVTDPLHQRNRRRRRHQLGLAPPLRHQDSEGPSRQGSSSYRPLLDRSLRRRLFLKLFECLKDQNSFGLSLWVELRYFGTRTGGPHFGTHLLQGSHDPLSEDKSRRLRLSAILVEIFSTPYRHESDVAPQPIAQEPSLLNRDIRVRHETSVRLKAAK
jgi:hypothetical protein